MLYILVQNKVFYELAKNFSYILSQKFGKERVKLIKEVTKHDASDHLFIIFGANVYEGTIPKHYILVQLEQSVIKSKWFDHTYIKMISQAKAILDYSLTNFQNLKQYNSNYYNFTIGYDSTVQEKESKKLDSFDNSEYDIAFYGQINLRREKLLKKLKDSGLKIKIIENLWGVQRMEQLLKAKVVVNLHYYESAIQEVVRLSYLLSLGIVVLSESSEDKVLDLQYSKFATIVPTEQLVSTAHDLVHNRKTWDQALTKVQKFRSFKTSLPDQLWENCPLILVNEPHITNMNDNIVNDENQLDSMICTSEDIANVEMKVDPQTGVLSVVTQKIDWDELPNLSVITLTRNREKIFPLAIRNIISQEYPLDKLEWIVVDSSDSPNLEQQLDKLPHEIKVKYIKYCDTDSQKNDHNIHPNLQVIRKNMIPLEIGYKRNIGCQYATAEYLAFMDDDDYYPVLSLYSRVAILISYPEYACVGVADLDVYETSTNRCARFKSPYLAEASMMFRRSFWEEQPFPEKRTRFNEGEGVEFTKSRRHQLIKMPCCLNMLAITHGNNFTGKTRQVEERLGCEGKGRLDLFKSLDLNTKMFLFDIFDK